MSDTKKSPGREDEAATFGKRMEELDQDFERMLNNMNQTSLVIEAGEKKTLMEKLIDLVPKIDKFLWILDLKLGVIIAAIVLFVLFILFGAASGYDNGHGYIHTLEPVLGRGQYNFFSRKSVSRFGLFIKVCRLN